VDVAAGHGDTPQASRGIDAVLRSLTRSSVPSLATIVVKGDRVISEQAIGLADIAGRRAATLDTVYLWFSMTKIVTATGAMQLVERGRLSLDDAVERYVPEFPHPRNGWPEVKVRHLLSHSSGLVNPIPVRWVHAAEEPARDPQEFTRELLGRYSKLRFPAGARASYTNLGYIVLGEVITAAAGQPYEDYVRRHILTPLGMARTDFSYRADLRGDAATGYQSRLNPMTPLFRRMLPRGITGQNEGRFLAFRPFCVDGAAYGGLIGSVRDAARFMSAHLDDGRANGVQLLSPDSVTQMQTITARSRKIDVGLGWFHRHSDHKSDERYLEHLGGGGGFFNMMRIYPDRGLGIAVMGNATSYDHQRLAAAALA
jgi:CubicO group peptidase (beta-lactamase class C family)